MRQEPVFTADAFDAQAPAGRTETPAGRNLARARPFRRLRLAGRFVCAAGLITALVLVAHDRATAPAPAAQGWSEPPRVAGASARAAVPVASGGPLLRLEAAGGEPSARAEPPRWNPASGLREDTLAQGGFDAIEAPFLVVTVTDAAQAADPDASLFVTLARRAADGRSLSVTRTMERGRIETKFGAFETVEATLSGEGSRVCTGFQKLYGRAVRIDGWLCGILGQAPDPRAVACALDRLTLSGTAASTVETAFADAETRRDPACRPADPAAEAARIADATGSIAPLRRRAGTRAGKNEAFLRRNAQAQR